VIHTAKEGGSGFVQAHTSTTRYVAVYLDGANRAVANIGRDNVGIDQRHIQRKTTIAHVYCKLLV
jgi:hypothetical protein